jgi:hypothetical protein
MADGSEQTSNNVRAGAFIILTVAVGISVFVILSGWDPFESRSSYKVSFTVEQGVNGLAKGSDVKVGGLIKGTVTGVSPQFVRKAEDSEQLDSILVSFEVDKDVTLWSNAEVTRYLPLLGGGAWLNFDSVGSPKGKTTNGGERLEAGGTLKASNAGGMLATLLGPANARKTSNVLANIDDFTVFLTEIPRTWNMDIVPMLDNADALVAGIRQDYAPWSEKITAFLERVDTASTKLDEAMDDIPPLIASAQKDLDDVGAILTENGPKLSAGLDNIIMITSDGKEIINEFKTDTLAKLDAILESGEQGIDSFRVALDRIDSELATRMPDITMMLGDLRQASAQLKLTALEVRRSPWKLLYTPSTSEVAHENLYESARSYVMATNELESASMAFREVFNLDPEATSINPELREQVQTYVLDALEGYRKAQERLFSEIVDQP